MEITVLHIAECPNWADAVVNVEEATSTMGADWTVTDRLISTPEEAAHWSFAGSPTILLDGLDLFPNGGLVQDLACRIYYTPEGLRGAPTSKQIRERLAASDR